MSLPPTEKMLAKVRKFVVNPVLLTSPQEIEAEMGIPDAWMQILRQQNAGIKSWVEPWEAYRDRLPGVSDFLQRKVRGVCILLEDRKLPSLLYVYSRGQKDYFYRGWPALGERAPEGKGDVWKLLPPGLQEFYSQLHDGWVYLSSDSLGPLPVQDIEFLSDQDWDLETDDRSRLPFRLNEVITVFSNGGGDLLGLDLGRGVSVAEDHALAWWHEEPLEPDIDQNFWALMDGWICGQMEDVDLAE